MPAIVPCLIQITIVANFIKIEKFVNSILIKTRWVPSSNMFLPCADTECLGNAYYTKIQTIGDDGKPSTIITLPLNCVYIITTGEGPTAPQTFETIQDLCAMLNAIRCAPCEIVGLPEGDCVVNISSITTDPSDEDRWILGTEGTTADGYVNLIFDAGGALVIPNPNGDIYSIEMSEAFIETLPSALTISRSLSETGDPICGAPYILSSFRDDVEIPEIGADTIYPIADIVGLPTCGGTVSYYLISDDSGLCSLNTVTGEVTITAGALAFDNYTFIAQICTTGGLPSVLSVVCLLIANPPLGLRLTYTPGNLPANNLAAWNAFFDLPANGTAFTSLSVTGDEVTLVGGAGITLKASLFRTSATLLKIEDDVNCVVAVAGGKTAGAVSLCSALTTITLNGVITAGDEAFYDNDALTSVSLSALTKVGTNALASNMSLATLSLPALTTAGTEAFRNNPTLTSFTANLLENAGLYVFDSTGLTSISLPALLSIGNGAFSSCVALTTVSMPIVTTLGASVLANGVFLGCASLTSITVPLALATANAGNPDGDLVYAVGTLGATVTYI